MSHTTLSCIQVPAIGLFPLPIACETRALSDWLKASGGTISRLVTMSESIAAARYVPPACSPSVMCPTNAASVDAIPKRQKKLTIMGHPIPHIVESSVLTHDGAGRGVHERLA